MRRAPSPGPRRRIGTARGPASSGASTKCVQGVAPFGQRLALRWLATLQEHRRGFPVRLVRSMSSPTKGCSHSLFVTVFRCGFPVDDRRGALGSIGGFAEQFLEACNSPSSARTSIVGGIAGGWAVFQDSRAAFSVPRPLETARSAPCSDVSACSSASLAIFQLADERNRIFKGQRMSTGQAIDFSAIWSRRRVCAPTFSFRRLPVGADFGELFPELQIGLLLRGKTGDCVRLPARRGFPAFDLVIGRASVHHRQGRQFVRAVSVAASGFALGGPVRGFRSFDKAAASASSAHAHRPERLALRFSSGPARCEDWPKGLADATLSGLNASGAEAFAGFRCAGVRRRHPERVRSSTARRGLLEFFEGDVAGEAWLRSAQGVRTSGVQRLGDLVRQRRYLRALLAWRA